MSLLEIGTSAVNAYQRSLAAVSNNIANIGTDGYSRQEVSIEAVSAGGGGLSFGSGVNVAGLHRAYSEFATQNLRSSYSAMKTQEPLSQYANQLIDMMGSGSSGLSPSISRFFDATRQLSAAPASMNARDIFLRSADEIATRFRTLSGGLATIETQSRGDIQGNVASLNTLAKQLAAVNTQLMASTDIKRQPPLLLDQRDQLLVQMSKIASIQVDTASNGEVSVGLGGSTRQGQLVAGGLATELGAVFSDSSAGKVDLVIDPYGKAAVMNSLSGGSLTGLLTFRQQALEPAQNKLDVLAQTFATEANRVHRSGIDAGGVRGKDLFVLAPVLQFQAPASHSNVWVDTTVVDPAATAFHDIGLRYYELSHSWEATDLVSGQKILGARDATELRINGLRLRISGTPQAAESVTLKAFARPAASIKVALDDPRLVAVGALFRATAAESNISAARAAVAYVPPGTQIGPQSAPPPGPRNIDGVLVNNPHPSSAVAFTNATPPSAVATIPSGYSNVALMLANGTQSNGTPSTLDLQVLTRDGRQLLGTPLSADQQSALLRPENGFTPGAGYSATYRNQTGANGYLDLNVFYGARGQATPGGDAAFVLRGSAIPASSLAAGQPYIAAGVLSLNGTALTGFAVPGSGSVAVQDLADWINNQNISGIDARASNAVRLPAGTGLGGLAFGSANKGITINGVSFGQNGAGFASATALRDAINADGTSGVVASVANGALVLKNTAGNANKDISIGTPAGLTNVLGVAPRVFSLDDTLVSLVIDGSGPLALGLASTGTAADLAKLGLRTGAYIDGTVPEDLLVFTTGAGAGAVAAGFAPGTLDALARQRSQPLQLDFSSATHYTITDTTTNTVVAERNYDPAVATIQYGGLTLTLSAPPATGDQFLVDGNQDGTGNNENIMRLAAMEDSKTAFGSSLTMRDTYNGIVSRVGNISIQAKTALDAMTVVNQQALSARESASGVSLDAEATDLIRFQQAYQAAAKTIQVATQLFDTLAQIR